MFTSSPSPVAYGFDRPPRNGVAAWVVAASIIVALGLGAGVGFGIASLNDTVAASDTDVQARATTTVDAFFISIIEGEDVAALLCDSDVADDLLDEIDDQLDGEIIDFTTYSYQLDQHEFSAYADLNDYIEGTLTVDLDDDKWCVDDIDIY